MFQVNLTHCAISDSTLGLQALAIIVQRHKAQNDRQEVCNARDYTSALARLAVQVDRLRLSNDRRAYASSHN